MARPFDSKITAVLVLAMLALTTACDQASAESKSQAAAPPAAAPPAAAPPAAAPAATPTAAADEPAGAAERKTEPRQSYQEEAFELSLTGPSAGKVEESLEFVVRLEAKAGYKVNTEYPIKFTFESSAAVVPEVPVLKKENGSIEKSQAELRGKLKVTQPGAHSVAGKLSFSVCTEERCLIEKRDLGLFLTAS